MFGYIFPDKPELKVKELELFKAYYCGLCKSIGSSCGQMARFSLNYDSSFLGLLLSSFNEKPETIKFEKCVVSPFIRKPVIRESKALEYASDINVMLSYYKLKDDFKDNRSGKSLAFMGILKPAFRKAISRNPEKGMIIRKKLEELSYLEKKGCESIDEAAEPFARLTEGIFAYDVVSGSENKMLLGVLGYNIGKWIYMLDSFDDIESDIKNKSFNPIINQFCYNNEKVSDFKDRIKENLRFTLTFTLSEAGNALEKLNLKKNKEIIDNIIYGGMYNKTLQILDKRSGVKNEKSL